MHVMVGNIKSIIRKLLHIGHQLTAPIDRPYLNSPVQCRWPPVFILGLPRSGTTLLYQVMVEAFHFAYFPNISNRFYMCPITAARVGLRVCSEYRSTFESDYGFENGCLAPSESGNIWNRWFPQERRDGFNYTPAGYLKPNDRSSIYQIIANFEHLFNAPFMTKNGKSCVRIPALLEIFPNALFIQIRREPVDTALSILLRLRKYRLQWWSVMPREVNSFRNDAEIERVCKQVHFISQNLRQDIQEFSLHDLHSIEYESLCRNPTFEIEKIHQFLNSKSCPVNNRKSFQQRSFRISSPRVDGWVKEDEIERIRNIISKLADESK